MSSAKLAVLARGVHKNFGAGVQRMHILQYADLGVAAGEIVFAFARSFLVSTRRVSSRVQEWGGSETCRIVKRKKGSTNAC